MGNHLPRYEYNTYFKKYFSFGISVFVCTYGRTHTLLLAFVEPGFGRTAHLGGIAFAFHNNSGYNGCCVPNLQPLPLLCQGSKDDGGIGACPV